MRFCDTYKTILTERKKIKYDMKNINGGFSDGVEIKPGANAGVMDVSVNIYGGGQGRAHAYQVPPQIQELQRAYLAATQTGDPVANEIKVQLEEYYSNLRRAIALEIVRLIQEFDNGANASISGIVQKINQRYQKQ